MAWVKVKDMSGNVLTVPESMYNDQFKWNKNFTLVKDIIKKEVVAEQPKPSPNIVKDERGLKDVQVNKVTNGQTVRKSPTKATI